MGIGYLSYHFPQTVFFIYRSPTNTVTKAPAAMRTIPNKISHSDREPSFDTSPVLIKIAIGDEITRPKIAQNVCTPYFSKRNVISFAIRKVKGAEIVKECLDRIDDRVIIAEDHQHHGAGNTRNYHCGRSHNTEDK